MKEAWQPPQGQAWLGREWNSPPRNEGYGLGGCEHPPWPGHSKEGSCVTRAGLLGTDSPGSCAVGRPGQRGGRLSGDRTPVPTDWKMEGKQQRRGNRETAVPRGVSAASAAPGRQGWSPHLCSSHGFKDSGELDAS